MTFFARDIDPEDSVSRGCHVERLIIFPNRDPICVHELVGAEKKLKLIGLIKDRVNLTSNRIRDEDIS